VSEPGRRIDETDLHAFVDGWLPEDRRAEIEHRLAESPDEQAKARAWRRQNDALAALVGDIADQPIPRRLDPRHLARAQRRRRLALAASVVALLAGSGIGWMARGWMETGDGVSEVALPRYAIAAHRMYTAEVRHPVDATAEERDHLVTWLSRRLGHELRIPDLGEAGFALVGGRLLPAGEGPAAQFMYEDETGRRLTLYVTLSPAEHKTAFRFHSAGHLSAFWWIDEDLGYALIAETDRDDLAGIAQVVYEQLAR
jgi:anti-sigma factor RsiW